MVEALDLFAGAGGWSLAAQRLGIDETGVEIMPEALETRAAAGFKSHGIGDVWEFDFTAARGVNGLIASPPCQTFSTAGKGTGRYALTNVLSLIDDGAYVSLDFLRKVAVQLGDERTALVLTPLHAAWEMRPEWIAWEQVPTVLPVWEACADELRSWGYSAWTGNLQAEMYGVPQTRKRAFLIAHRDREVAPPTPTHSRYYSRSPERLDPGVKKWVSMAEGLGWGLVQRPSYTVCGVSAHAVGDREWGGASVRKALAEAAASGDPSVWMRSNYGTGGDASKRGERTLDQPAPTITSKVDRNRWIYDRPAPTIVGTRRSSEGLLVGRQLADSSDSRHVGGRDGSVGLGDGQLAGVRVTVEEAGVLQSFPADFAWQGPKTKQYLQVGNAVPPGLAEAVLRQLL